jgi:S1-C subfamily serine protease
MPRLLNPDEVARFETQRGFVVLAMRDGSPAYLANMLPGDVVLQVNGQQADTATWMAAAKSGNPLSVHLMRNGQPRDVVVTVPADWRPD